MRHHLDTHIHPGGGRFFIIGSSGDLNILCPETLHPNSGSSLIRTFLVSPCELFHVSWAANLPRVSSGSPYISVGIAEVFQTPVVVSLDVLIMVATKNARLSKRRAKGKTSHAQLIWMKFFRLNALPSTISLLTEERSRLVMAVASRSI